MIAFIWHFALAESGEIKVIETVLFSLVCGLLGGTFYYIRKLYKSCIQSVSYTHLRAHET